MMSITSYLLYLWLIRLLLAPSTRDKLIIIIINWQFVKHIATNLFILMTSCSLLFSLLTSASPVVHIHTIQCHHTHLLPHTLAPPTMLLLLFHGHDLSLTLIFDNREMSLQQKSKYNIVYKYWSKKESRGSIANIYYPIILCKGKADKTISESAMATYLSLLPCFSDENVPKINKAMI